MEREDSSEWKLAARSGLRCRAAQIPAALGDRQHLRHLIEGTTSSDKTIHVPGFGDTLVTEITTAQILEWKKGISTLVYEMDDYKPGTTNAPKCQRRLRQLPLEI
jgi:hypothetical protein